MIDQLFDSFQKASEFSVAIEQEMFERWAELWPEAPFFEINSSAAWVEAFQQRLIDRAADSLERNRVALDSTYRSGMQLIDETVHQSAAKSPDSCRRTVEDLWRKMIDDFKDRSETLLRDFQSGVEECADKLPVAKG